MTETELRLLATQNVLIADGHALLRALLHVQRQLRPLGLELDVMAEYETARKQMLHTLLLNLEKTQPALAAQLQEMIEASYPDLRF